MATTHMLLVAQSPVLCYGIRTVLESILSVEGVTEATGALEAAGNGREAQAGLVFVHDALPGVTGDVTVTMLRQLLPAATIVMMSDDDSDTHRVRARSHGVDALYSMAIDPDAFSAEIGALSARLPIDRVRPESAVSGLSIDLIAVLDGIVRGFEPWVIADRLRVEREIVDRATDSLLAELESVDRTSAVLAAIRLGLVDLHDQLPVTPYHPEYGIESAA